MPAEQTPHVRSRPSGAPADPGTTPEAFTAGASTKGAAASTYTDGSALRRRDAPNSPLPAQSQSAAKVTASPEKSVPIGTSARAAGRTVRCRC